MSDWFTYTQAAERFGISAEAVRQLAIRRKWPRRRPNDAPFGQVQVLIPIYEQIRPRPTVQRSDEQASDTPIEHPSNGRWPADLDALIEHERDRADRAEQRAEEAARRAEAADTDRRAAIALADQSVTLLAEAAARADRTEAALTSERARADALRDRLEQAQAELAVAQHDAQAGQQAAAELRRAEADRKARGRLRRAWDGWRGR